MGEMPKNVCFDASLLRQSHKDAFVAESIPEPSALGISIFCQLLVPDTHGWETVNTDISPG